MDVTPPEQSEIYQDNDFTVFQLHNRMLRPEHGTKATVWEDTGKPPTYADCAGVVDTQGTTKDIDLKMGTVVCARTGQGTIARLTTKMLAGQAFDVRGAFDVVTWNNT